MPAQSRPPKTKRGLTMNEVAGQVLAGDVLDWYKGKIGEVEALITPTLVVVAGFFAILLWITARSWKKAVIVLVGGAIVIAIVAQIRNVSDKVETELDGAPPPAMVGQPHDHRGAA